MIDLILGLIGMLLYPLFSVIFVFLRGIQNLFYAFAGVGAMTFDGTTIGGTVNSGAETDSGIIYFLFQTPVVRNMLFSIMFLALFLVVIFTVMAFIKNMYAAKPKGWKEIIGSAIKGLANFVFLPICCLLGVWLGNILLQAINGATSSGGTTSMDRKLFICSAVNANKFRTGALGTDDDTIKELQDWANGKQYLNSNETYKGSSIQLGQDAEYYALIVDDIYANTNVNIQWYTSVGEYYSLFEINYLVLIAGGIFMLYALCALAFAMVRRLFILIILFIISPGVCALYPLDDGKAVGQWKDKFVKEFLSVYGSIAGINIFFSIMPLIDKIGIVGLGADLFMNSIIQIFILTSGLMCVKEVTGLISGLIGANDAYGNASSQMKSTVGKAAKVGVGVAVASKFVGRSAAKVGKATYTAAKETGAMIGKGAKAVGSGVKSIGGDVSKKFNDARDSRAQMKGFQSHADMKAKNKQDKQDEKIKKKATAAGLTIQDYKSQKAAKKISKEMNKQIRKDKFDSFKQDVSDKAHAFGAGVSDKAHAFGDWAKGTKLAKGVTGIAKGVGGSMKKAGDAARASAEKSGLADSAKKAGSGFKGLGKQLGGFAGDIYEETGAKGWIKKNVTTPFKDSDERYAERRSTKKKEASANAQEAILVGSQQLEKKVSAAEEAKKKLGVKSDGSLDTKKVSAAELEVLRIQSQATNNKGQFTSGALKAQDKLKAAVEKNEKIDDYKTKQSEAEAAAEALKSKLDAAAEAFKGGMKDAAKDLSTAVKKALDEDSLGENLGKALEKAFKKVNPQNGLKSDAQTTQMKNLLQAILDELKNKK